MSGFLNNLLILEFYYTTLMLKGFFLVIRINITFISTNNNNENKFQFKFKCRIFLTNHMIKYWI